MTVEQYKAIIKGVSVSVVGLGISNVPLIDFLLRCGAEVVGRDKKSPDALGEIFTSLKARGVTLRCGEDYLDGISEKYVFRSPGIRNDIPEFAAAANNGSIITSEMELFFELCPCDIIAVTGSDGKTTTTTLTYLLLTEESRRRGDGRTIYVGGNIGAPLIGKLNDIKSDDIAVLELSSFQLQTMKKSPHRAAVTNVSPNHLNWHTGMDEYIAAKTNIFRHQSSDGLVVLNYENGITRGFADIASGKVCFFSSKRVPECENAVFERDGVIFTRADGVENKITDTSDIKLIGRHNVENYMTAIALTQGLVSPETVRGIAREFGGVEHRCELVRELDGVKYYNSSIDSSPSRTIAALSCFSVPLVVIMGGYDKNLDYSPLALPVFDHARAVVLTGATSDKVYSALNSAGMPEGFICERVADFKDAVIRARALAMPGDCVILSPAAASFDRFKNFEERGRFFKSIVNGL